MSEPRFVHLRVHTAYSLAEGALKIPALAEMCNKFSMPACAITDTNAMFGVPEFCKYMTSIDKKHGVEAAIQPIIGAQVSVDFGLSQEAAGRDGMSELVLLVQNETGYANLMKLISDMYIKQQPGKSVHLSPDGLAERAGGLICLTGGVSGPIGQALLAGQTEIAAQKCSILEKIFPGKLYMEIQRHGLPEEEETEPGFLSLAYERNIPLVATNECFFLARDKHYAHDIFLCINGGHFYDEETRRRETAEHYFKSPEEMCELFADLPEAIENTIAIAKRCAFKIKKSKPLLPRISGAINSEEQLMLSARAGLEERLTTAGIEGDARKPYLDQFVYEVGVITQMGFADYFLIVADFIAWAKKNGIPVGPGRGSGAGSIVSWALEITDLNPLQFGLLFERFLNPERVSMPDFDIDFCQDRREEVINYVQGKYGADSVGQIITFGKLQSKNSIRDTGRVLRLSYTKCDDLCKLVPNLLVDNRGEVVEASISNLMKYAPDFKAAVEGDQVYRNLVGIASQVEGLYRNVGMHAAGVVIGDRPLDLLVPLYKDPDSTMPVASYNMKYIEDTGLIKYDFLGLKTLSIIQKAVEMIERTRGIKVDISHIPTDDENTYALISAGNTEGVFQLESGGMRQAIAEMRPNRIEDLIALVALYRPGPMENIPSYCRRKHGAEKIEYLHPLMESSLAETYGIMVYQEQVISMGRLLAGYTLGSADLLRRAMGKKIRAEMAQQRIIFIEGCKKTNNIDGDVAGRIFDLMEKFADYGFNKSHAACYAWISYQTAYLKANFMPEFMAATLTYDMADQDKLAFFASNAKASGIKILRPDINKSFEYFNVENGSIQYSLAAIKGIGVNIVRAIVAEREARGEFKDFPDFMERMDKQFVNKKMLEGLIFAGAFDGLEPNRAKLHANIEYILAQMNAIARDKQDNQASLFGDASGSVRDEIKLANAAPWRPMEALEREREVLGFYVSAHPLDAYEAAIESLKAISTVDVRKLPGESKAVIAGTVDKIQKRVSKAGNTFWITTISDKSGSAEVLFFSRNDYSHERNIKALEGDVPVAVGVDVKAGEGRVSLFGSYANQLSLSSAISGVLSLSVASPDAVAEVKNALSKVGSGYTNIDLVFEDNGKQAVVRLPNRYNITAETVNMFRSIGGVQAKVA